MTVKRCSARLSILAIGLFALAGFHSTARGQARVSYTGGLGTPLTIILIQPVTFTITTAVASNSGPLFDLQGAGNYFFTPTTFSGSITDSVNGGAAQSINAAQSNDTNGSVAPQDILLYGTFIAVPVGATVVLSAGSMTSSSSFFSNRPLDGTFPTFIATYAGTVESTNGVSPAPEPSTWAALLAGAGLLGVALRWRETAKKSR